MSPALRRITVRETGAGLEALAVFLGHGGLMLGPSSWDRIRLDAWRRIQRHAADDPLAPCCRRGHGCSTTCGNRSAFQQRARRAPILGIGHLATATRRILRSPCRP